MLVQVRSSIARQCLRQMSTISTPEVQPKSEKKVNRSMQYYMEKRRQHDEFIAKERSEFELGKKHLANMMGMEANAMTQEDIDKAISYLFPSGLFEPDARPIMKPPEVVFPLQKDAEFGLDGRPHHPFFYTTKPQYTQILYETAEHIQNVTLFGERMKKMKVPPNPDEVLNDTALSTTRWANLEELKKMLIEDIKAQEHADLLMAFERLLEQPFSYKARDFIFKYRKPVGNVVDSTTNIIQPEYDSEGRGYVEFLGQRKSSVAKVKVSKPGSGQISIKHVDYMDIECDVTYFHSYIDRHTVMYPLQFTNLLGLVDVECVVDAGGPASQAGAIRYALAMCLRSFTDETTVEEMKVCGLLTQDVRVRERKKFGQEGARRKFTWKKR